MDSQRDIDQYLQAHEIKRVTIEGFAFRYREVVIDMRAVKDGSLEALVFEHAKLHISPTIGKPEKTRELSGQWLSSMQTHGGTYRNGSRQAYKKTRYG